MPAILPTLNCNLACTYCYEATNLKDETMSPGVVEQLKEYMKTEYSSLNTKLQVHWYGGEPLLAYGTMKEISKFLDFSNTPFKASIVTNGILLNEEKILSINQLKIDEIQITLDGLKDTHDKKRIFKNKAGTFDIIMKNMKFLHEFVQKNNHIHVDIRINVDKDNEDEYHILYNKLKAEFPLFNPYAGILRQYISCGSTIPCFVNQTEVAEFHIKQYKKYGLIEPVFYPFLKGMTYCMAESPHSDMVGPKGEMYLCLKDAGDKNEIIGNIFNGKNNIRLIANYCTGNLTFNSAECKDCNVVSLCGGGCPNIKYRNLKYGESNDPCVPFKKQHYLEEYLDLHYEMKNNMQV